MFTTQSGHEVRPGPDVNSDDDIAGTSERSRSGYRHFTFNPLYSENFVKPFVNTTFRESYIITRLWSERPIHFEIL